MSEPLQLIIRNDGVTICGEPDIRLSAAEEVGLGKRLAEYFITRGITSRAVVLFLAEEMLFYKTFPLPLNTGDLKQAITFQLDMLAPFPEEDLLYSYSTQRQKEQYRITLACASRQVVEPCLKEIAAADIRIAGLYPEFMRYLSKSSPRDKWGLLIGGRLGRLLVFDGQQLVERMLFPATPPLEELTALAGTDRFYQIDAVEEGPWPDARKLLGDGKLNLKEFNLLPATYRRPEFSRFFIILLLVLNAVALLGLIGGKEYQFRSLSGRVDSELAKLAPLAREAKELRVREQQLEKYLASIGAVGANPDLIPYLKKMSDALPATAFLDQVRLDSKTKSLDIQGYAGDINELTAKLPEFGEAKLKSTSRRKDKIYFDVEVALP